MARLLVIDDEANIRMLYTQELGEDGHEVVAAATVSEAIARLEEQGFDLVVLDIKLKNESGLDLLQKIVKEQHNLPVILCSAYSCYRDDFSAWLADGYVVKSSNIEELKLEIKKVLDKRVPRVG